MYKEGEEERRLVLRLAPAATCVEILEAAVREGFAEIDCIGVTRSLRDHLLQSRERFQQQGEHRFDDLIIELGQSRLLIYPSQTGAWHPKGGAKFFMTGKRIVRCR
jgi:hypothetical protein